MQATLVTLICPLAAALVQQPTRPADTPGLQDLEPQAAMRAPTPQATPPQLTPVRWNEDWSFLRDAPHTDFFDPIKFIPLSDDGSAYLSLGGSARYRWERFENAGFGAGPQDDDGFHLLRLLAHADLHVGERFRVFVQGISANADGRTGGERLGIDENDLDIHQAFADLRLRSGEGDWLTIRGGRQNLLYGAQRLISPLDWTNTRRTFDGVKLSRSYGLPGSTFDLFWARPVIVDEGPLDEWYDDGTDFAGIYNSAVLARGQGGAQPTRLEQYLLYLDRESASFSQGTGEEQRLTLGARFYTNPAPFDLDVEGAYQFGDFNSPAGNGDISAFFIAAEAGIGLAPETTLAPRLFFGGTYASGDDDPDDADLGTFNQLFPLAHAYLGHADVLGRQNVIDLYAGADLDLLPGEARFAKKLALQATWHAFWRASDDDSIYTTAGAVGRSGGDDRFIGTEIDLLLNWQIDRHLSAHAGFSHFFASDFIEQTGPSEDLSFLYFGVQYAF